MSRSVAPTRSRRGFRNILSAVTAVLVATTTVLVATPAMAVPTVHEITARWAAPAPTEAPYGQAVTAEWRINTNDASDPFANEDVANVRATLTATNGVFTSIPSICKTTDVTPVSEISADGTTLLCNVGTVREGTSTVIQSPVRASGTDGGNLTLSGTATSDSAVAEAGPADPGPLPITYTHGLDLSLSSAPGQGYQGNIQESRTGGDRVFILMNFSLILAAGSRPGPEAYSFPLTVASNVAGATNGLQWEGCVPVGASSAAPGQPFSDAAQADRSNFPGCAVTGSSASYTVSLSDLDYSLVNTPVRDSMGQPLPGNDAYVASGTVQFSIPNPVSALTNYTFTAAPGPFTFSDGVQSADGSAANNSSETTLPPPGGFNNHWSGTPADGRSAWDANLWVSPGTSSNVSIPVPGVDDIDDWADFLQSNPTPHLPLYMQANSQMWRTYQGPGGAQLAGVCTMSQSPDFVFTNVDGGGWTPGVGYVNYSTARIFYTTQAIDTKTETCGQTAPSAMWTEVTREPGTTLGDPRIGDQAAIELPAGVTALKMTWDPAVDRSSASGHTFLRGLGYISPDAPTSGEGWTVGTFNAPYDLADSGWGDYPILNNWLNNSTVAGGANLPDSAYGPNMNGARDAFRLQGPLGLITKAVNNTTAEPGVPVTYSLQAQAQSSVPNPPAVSFSVVDTLPEGMEYVAGSASPEPTSVDGRVLTWNFTDVAANVNQPITYQGQIPEGGAVAPGSRLTNTAVVNVPGDNRPVNVPGRTARATVLVPGTAATSLAKSSEDNLLSFFGDTSEWVLRIASNDPEPSAFTDTIDIVPQVGDGRGTNIDGTYDVTGVTAPAGSTVYYTDAPLEDLSSDPRDPSNGDAPGSVDGNTVDWSTTALANPTAIRVIGPELAPGAAQTIRIAYETPAATSCESPADDDNKPGQILVNSATSIAEHTELPMLSSVTTTVGNCYAVDLKKYVQDAAGEWHDANDPADYPTFQVGDTVRYRIVVENVGQGTVTNLEVTDDLQPELGSFVVESLAGGESETHEFEIVLEAGGPDEVVNTACGTADIPADGDPATILCDPAGFEVEGEPTHTKSIVSAEPIGGGQWEIVYELEVVNSSTASTSYSLADELHFTDQVDIASATVTESPDGVTLADPAWDGQGNLDVATDVPLLGSDDDGYAPHTYLLTVVADVPLQFAPGGDLPATECAAEGENTDTAFNNTSELTLPNGDVEPDQACATPPEIDIDKSVSSGPTPNDDGTWTVTYDLVATNTGGVAAEYDISDRMTASGDMTVESGQITSVPDGVTVNDSWTGEGAEGSAENIIASGVSLPAGGTHTYQVEVVIGLADGTAGAPVITECSEIPADGDGLSNSAEIEHNDLTADDSACVTVGIVTVDKSVSAGPTPNGDGTWTVVYDIVATHAGGAAADYDVTDRLHFGEGIDIVDREVRSLDGIDVNADWTGDGAENSDAENIVAEGITLAVGGSHTYQVEVTVEMDESTIDPTALQCAPGAGDAGGLGNSTTLTSNGILGEDTVCPSVPLIRLDKTIVEGSPVANGDGTWTIAYDVSAANIGQAPGDYDMSDRLMYGDGLDVQESAIIDGPDDVTPNADWTGQGAEGAAENEIVADQPLEVGETHTFRVEVIATMDRSVVTPDTLACPAPGEAGGFANTAELEHNGEEQNAAACVPPPLIEIDKSLSGAVVPVDGQDGVYDATYELTVTNSGPGTGVYDLDDQLAPGEGVTVVGIQDVSSDVTDGVAINDGFNGVDDVRIVTEQAIGGADGAPVVHTYTVVVRYAAELSGIELPTGDSCTSDGGEALPGTLNNTATVGWNGLDDADAECIVPGKPTLDKAIVSATPIGDGQWEVIYDLTVGNTGNEATTYDLDDELLFAPQISVDSITVDGPADIALNDGFDGDADQRIATDINIIGLDDDGYAPHVYQVTVIANVPLTFDDADTADDGTGSPACTAPAGGNFAEQGLNNAATLTDENGGTIVDTDCAPVPSTKITKTMDGDPVAGEDGRWTVNYTITVLNDGAAAGPYTLTDQLRYGTGITVIDATVTEAPEDVIPAATWTGLGEAGAVENVVASDVSLAAGGTHTYRVTVETHLDTDAADATAITCPEPGSGDRGGFSNIAGVNHNGLTADAAACAVPEWPEDVPPPLAVTGGEGVAWFVLATALILLAGGGVLMIARRRRATESADADLIN